MMVFVFLMMASCSEKFEDPGPLRSNCDIEANTAALGSCGEEKDTSFVLMVDDLKYSRYDKGDGSGMALVDLDFHLRILNNCPRFDVYGEVKWYVPANFQDSLFKNWVMFSVKNPENGEHRSTRFTRLVDMVPENVEVREDQSQVWHYPFLISCKDKVVAENWPNLERVDDLLGLLIVRPGEVKESEEESMALYRANFDSIAVNIHYAKALV